LEEQEAGFYVRFLGGLYLEFAGKRIKITKNLKQKSIQILLILLKAGSEGVSRSQLIEMLEWEGEQWERKLNNLRCQTCKLRRLISESGFPKGKYILASKGRYYFSMNYQVETDTGRIDKLYKKLRSKPDSDNREIWLREIVHLYQGEFLPVLVAEEWAVVENAHYHTVYTCCLNELCQILREQEDYRGIFHLCTKACQIHPYDEWQAVQIECLVAQHRYQDAVEISEKANKVFAKELGVVPFQKGIVIPPGFDKVAKQEREIMDQVMERLSEKEQPHGAYQCSYPHFIDICRFLMRISEREETELVLLLCTLIPGPEKKTNETLEEDKDFIKLAERFRSQLAGLIRNQDVYTRYSENQFLVLLTAAAKGGNQSVRKRLRQGFREFEEKEGMTVELEIQILNTRSRKEAM